jgi:hypothetical protein
MSEGIRIITSAEISANAAVRWRGQYWKRNGDTNEWAYVMLGNSEEIYNALLAANGDKDKIAAAIGNKGWSHVSCDVCHEFVDVGVCLGEYESKTICGRCLRSAVAAVDAVERIATVAR